MYTKYELSTSSNYRFKENKKHVKNILVSACFMFDLEWFP